MRMSHLASIAFACSISLFSTASFAQSPSEDGLCGELLHGETPSLYGLCIAYWATQNNGNSDASSKILEKYDARKPEDGPDMPGLCPCWTAEELTRWEANTKGKETYCIENVETYDDDYTGWARNDDRLYAVDKSELGYFGCAVYMSSTTNGGSGQPAVGLEIYNDNPDMNESSFQSCFNDAEASAIAVECN